MLTVHPKGAKLLYSDGGEVRAVHSRDRMYGMVCVSRGELLGVLKR
ncbi:MAG: hypothetical protein IJV72_06545 [Clostridia bacterium]|nr:hypothetical protein [Clostridia bacterium]